MSRWWMVGFGLVLALATTLVILNRSRPLHHRPGSELSRSRDVILNVQKMASARDISVNQNKRENEKTLGRVNRGVARYSEEFYRKFRQLVARKAEAKDSEVIRLIRGVLDPPSTNPMLKLSHPVVKTPQALAIHEILQQKRGGFFVECGALDGERSSNSLFLERDFGWTGVLVEMDPHFYTQVLGKARKSWSINACLSPHNYVTELNFQPSAGGQGTLHLNQEDKLSTTSAPCFPLESILLALNRSHVDYFSLDVEGVEINILRTVPFDRLRIDTLSVEYRHGDNSKMKIRNYMESQGYTMYKDIQYDNTALPLCVKDLILVRNDIMKSFNSSTSGNSLTRVKTRRSTSASKKADEYI